jgi:hypothetical protein
VIFLRMKLFGGISDGLFDSLMKALKIRSLEISREKALAYAGDLKKFYAVELTYKNTPVRLIVAANSVPYDLAVTRAIGSSETVAGADQKSASAALDCSGGLSQDGSESKP